MIVAVHVVLLMLTGSTVGRMSAPSSRHGASTRNQIVSQKALRSIFSPIAPIVAEPPGSFINSSCEWLRGSKRQKKMCNQSPDLSRLLASARRLSQEQCSRLFEHDRWNCTFRPGLFRKIYRETAFMHALSAALLAYQSARICSKGGLKECACTRPDHALWAGCDDDLKFGRRLARDFFGLRTRSLGHNRIIRHDAEIGIQAVIASVQDSCKCHGVSGSCTAKTCWKRVGSLEAIGSQLKRSYHNARMILPENHIRKRIGKREMQSFLWYTEKSPNFCNLTSGRKCLNADNCATLCCGRSYNTDYKTTRYYCGCQWKSCCRELKCNICERTDEVFTCK